MKQALRSVAYCFKLSWNASVLYTLVRLVGRLVIPLTSILQAYIIKRIIDTIALGASGADDPGGRYLYALIAATVLLTVLSKLMGQWVEYCSGRQREMLTKVMTLRMMESVLNADIEMFDNPEYYDQMSNATRDSYMMSDILWSSLDTVSSFLSGIGAFIVLCGANWLYGALVLLTSVPSTIASGRFTKLAYNLDLEQITDQRKSIYIHQLATDKQHAQEVRLFNIGGLLRDRYTNIWNTMFARRTCMVKKRSVVASLLILLPELVSAGIIADVSFRAIAGIASVGDFSLYTGLVGTLIGAVSMFITSYTILYDYRQRIDRVRNFLETNRNTITGGSKTLKEVEEIEFRDVVFRYTGDAPVILDGVSFLIKKGEKVAFVGVNGAGKSTIVKLLLRFYDPSKGEIRINGTDIREYTLKSLRRQFSIYFQNAVNYGFSIKENVTLGDPDREYRESDAKDALYRAGARGILEKASEGIDTPVYKAFSENGIELSGGENQSLALSRMFYRECSALILDEPSSSLDPEAESVLFSNIQTHAKDKTTIFTSHRLSNVWMADRIIVIESGRVIEEGTQKELLMLKRRYAELFNLQAEKYRVDGEF